MLCLSKGLTSLLAGGILSSTLLTTGHLSARRGDHVPLEKVLGRRVTPAMIDASVRAFVAWHMIAAAWCWAREGWALVSHWTVADDAAFLVCTLSIAARATCLKELGSMFCFEIGIKRTGHRLVTTGPYTYIRHPSYAGYILASLTFFYFVGMRSWVWWLLEICRVALMNVFRIPQEEAVLHQKFGKEWEKYCRRTWRLFPFIY